MRSTNLAGRAGRWSAAHWKTATFGSLAVAVLAVVVGHAVGVKQMKSWAVTNGESRRAEQILDSANFKIPARESVLVQSGTRRVGDPTVNKAIADVVRALSAQPNVVNIVSPLRRPDAGLVSNDRRSVLVQFDIRGKLEGAKDKVKPILATVARVQAANPTVASRNSGPRRPTTRSASASTVTCIAPSSPRCR